MNQDRVHAADGGEMRTAIRTAAALLAGCACAVSVHASEEQAAAAAPSSAGMKVAVDAKTGRFRAPTEQELQALAAQDRAMGRRNANKRGRMGEPRMPRTEAEALRTKVEYANGMVSMDVPEDLMTELVAVRRADGTVEIVHGEAGQAANAEVSDE
jgi:hypothetical protein